MARRANGEGSFFKETVRVVDPQTGEVVRRHTGRWIGQHTISRSPRRYITVKARTQAEARQRLAARLREHHAGEASVQEASGSRQDDEAMSVRELFDAWDEHLLWRVEQDDIRLSTVTYYRWARPHIESVLGEVRVVDVSTDTLKPLFDVKRHPTLSKGSIAKLRTCVSSLLGFAQEELKVIKHNVVRDMKPLRLKEKNDRSAMSPEQAAKLAGYLRSRALKGGMEIIWLTILSLGLRRSEALGLRWMDLDLEKGVVKIRKQLVWGADKGMGRLKTVSSERALALPKELTSILKRHKRAQALQRLALGKEWKVADAVFDHNGRYWYPSSVSAGFKRLTTWKKVDPDTDEEVLVSGKEWLEHPEERSNWVVHELRHTYASLLFDEGFEISTISALLGHSSETVTLDLYVHLLKKVPRNAAKAMGGCLFGKRKAS